MNGDLMRPPLPKKEKKMKMLIHFSSCGENHIREEGFKAQNSQWKICHNKTEDHMHIRCLTMISSLGKFYLSNWLIIRVYALWKKISMWMNVHPSMGFLFGFFNICFFFIMYKSLYELLVVILILDWECPSTLINLPMV